jgi:hypothetical protein
MNLLVEIEVECPHCGESWTTSVDTSAGNYSTIEDCPVCCRPIEFTFACEPGEVFAATTDRG